MNNKCITLNKKIRISAWISEYDRISVELTICGNNLVCKNIDFCFVVVPIMIFNIFTWKNIKYRKIYHKNCVGQV